MRSAAINSRNDFVATYMIVLLIRWLRVVERKASLATVVPFPDFHHWYGIHAAIVRRARARSAKSSAPERTESNRLEQGHPQAGRKLRVPGPIPHIPMCGSAHESEFQSCADGRFLRDRDQFTPPSPRFAAAACTLLMGVDRDTRSTAGRVNLKEEKSCQPAFA